MSIIVDIHKKLDNFILDVSFRAENETLALFGASGCGKSMTLKCIAGIEKPDEGHIELDGKVLFDSAKRINLTPQKRNTGYLFQQYALFPNMTVEQNIVCGFHGRKDEKRIAEMIKAMHLEGMEKKYPNQLSGGQCQRTALARILVGEPDVLMLDEPFSALDSHLRYQMEEEVRHTIGRFGKSVLLVSHDRDEVFRLSDRVAVMCGGKIEKLDEKRSIFKNPGTVNGAMLTGYRNISAVVPVGESRVMAIDWGSELEVNSSPKGVNFIGVRTEAVKLSEGENMIKCVVAELIANPFTYTAMVRPANGNGKATFAVTIGKNDFKAGVGDEIMISIPKENIVLLER